VLLEFLVKNGSERVVDDARTHIATIKILRNFHFIDDKGKDQGVNGTPFPKQTYVMGMVC
jgi:epsin